MGGTGIGFLPYFFQVWVAYRLSRIGYSGQMLQSALEIIELPVPVDVSLFGAAAGVRLTEYALEAGPAASWNAESGDPV